MRSPALSESFEPWFTCIRWTVFPFLRAWFDWDFEGLEEIPAAGPVLIACNHASYLDPLVNAYAVVRAKRRPRFLAKDDLFRAFGIRWAMRGTRQIPVARGTGDQSPLRNAEAALRANQAVVVYPEGTVTRRPDGLPMEGKTGTVRLALAAGVPILPLVSWGSAPVWQKSGPGSLRPGRPILVRVGDPFDVAGRGASVEDHDAVRALTDELMGVLTAGVDALREAYPPAWASR
jgi:1-acyl-sn-glycerol-3-phosphate acyltransferase